MSAHDVRKPSAVYRCPHLTLVRQPNHDAAGDPSPIYCVSCGADMAMERISAGMALPDYVGHQLDLWRAESVTGEATE